MLLFQVQTVFSQSSCIVAGDSTLANYTNLIPDEYAPPDTFSFDIDYDGTLDFKVEVWKVFTSYANYGNAHIVAYGQNKILANTANQSFADTLSNTDTICSSGVWKTWSYLFNYNTTFDSTTSYGNYIWNGLTNRYAGLKIINPIDSTYGWIQIYVSSSGAVTINNYGCDNITPYLAPTPPVSSDIISYPNPTYDIVNINLPNYSNYEIKLLNDVGEIVYQNIGNQKVVDLSVFPVGLYVLKIITSDKIFTEKNIKQKYIL